VQAGMHNIKSAFALLVVAAIPASSRPAGAVPAAAAPPSVVEIWVRGAGVTQGDAAPRGRSQKVDLDSLRLVDGKRFDAQYGGPRAVRGVALSTLIGTFAPDATLDLAILHFANGMAIPIAFRDADAMKRLDPFVARGMEARPGGPVRIGLFPEIRRKGATDDPRPTTFSGNKVVVAALWHPDVAATAQPAFSPWRHTDTLTGVELVAAKAYYGQFAVGGDDLVQRGQAVFQQSCQFCHGVRKVGAKFGWDFVEPAPIWSLHRPSKNLFLHVAYKPLDAAERGLMMPAMSFMSQDDAELLWHWLKAVATKPLPAYAPPAVVGAR
jgi:mono/diheme cytochrome c family protein